MFKYKKLHSSSPAHYIYVKDGGMFIGRVRKTDTGYIAQCEVTGYEHIVIESRTKKAAVEVMYSVFLKTGYINERN